MCAPPPTIPVKVSILTTKLNTSQMIGEKLAVILNNLGGTSKLEELVLAREIVQQLETRGYKVVR